MQDFNLYRTQMQRAIAVNNLVGNVKNPSDATFAHQLLKIIIPETQELIDGLDALDAHEIQDGIADVGFTIAGMYGRMGYDLPAQLSAQYRPCGWRLEDVKSLAFRIKDTLLATEALSVPVLMSYEPDAESALENVLSALMAMSDYFEIDAALDLAIVVNSQFTKFDSSETEAAATAAKYATLNVPTYFEAHQYGDVTYYVTFSAEDSVGNDGKSYPKNKWLKSVNFKEPVFEKTIKGF